MYMPVQIVFQH